MWHRGESFFSPPESHIIFLLTIARSLYSLQLSINLDMWRLHNASASLSYICCSLSHRRHWAPRRRHWPWTGTSARPCCLCWPAAPLSLPARSTTHSWSTPRCRLSTVCPKAAHSPKPKGTPLRTVCWLSASKACQALSEWKYQRGGVIFQTMLLSNDLSQALVRHILNSPLFPLC